MRRTPLTGHSPPPRAFRYRYQMVTAGRAAHNVRTKATESECREEEMDWRVRALTGALMTLVICVIVTFVATWLAVGLDPTFLKQWAKAFVVAWPIAAFTAFFVLPSARNIAERIVGR
jgi:hypothetical protein